MTKKPVTTSLAPAAIGPYSQGIDAGNLVFTSGQLPIDVETGVQEKECIAKATTLVLRNIESVLAAAGTTMDKVVKTTIYLANFADFKAMNEAYQEFFKENPPARTTIEAAKLPLDALVEIEAIAIK